MLLRKASQPRGARRHRRWRGLLTVVIDRDLDETASSERGEDSAGRALFREQR